MYQSFESLEVWKRASRLAVATYRALSECRDFGLKDQMTRAAVSIPSNIAEGYERGTNPEFIRFLNIAKGSTAELRTQLYIAAEIGVVSKQQMAELAEETRGIGAMLNKLASARRSRAGETDDIPTIESLNRDTAGPPETGNRNPETAF